jgi:glycosyltransferase involved in cell wall biosynthesis
MTENVLPLSVIMPAHQAAHLLPDTLSALLASDLPRREWELIVVDDASTDDTSEVARKYVDRELTLSGKPGGPGVARNAGAAIARGDWLVFIDSDVRVHSDTLTQFACCIERHPDAVAIFGAYDDQPDAPGLVSQYRNLLHRYVHLRGAGDAETFWAGCGAVRSTAFAAVNGFDTIRFPRPQIEDIELGYRLRDNGGRIVLDPSIQGTHLKNWTFWKMIRTDIADRGIPWMRLLLERRGKTRTSLNTGATEQFKVILAGAFPLFAAAGIAMRSPTSVLTGVACLVMLLVLNMPLVGFFLRVKGPWFAIATIPLQLIHYWTNALSAAIGLMVHFLSAGRKEELNK